MSDEHDDDPPVRGAAGTREPPPPLLRPRPPRPRRRSRTRYRLRRAIALFALVVIGFAAWFAWSLWQPFAGSGSGPVVKFAVAQHESTRTIGDQLAGDGVVDSGFFFAARAYLSGDELLPGNYTLRHGMSYSAALEVLTKRPPVKHPRVVPTVKLTIPEGFTRAQIAVLAHTDGISGSYLRATRHVKRFPPRSYGAPAHLRSLEGFLFPATYDLTKGEPARTLVAQQLLAFRQNFDGLGFAHAHARGLTRYDVLIIASMIEREAQVPGDRALVAAVIYNRLRDGIPLGIDATLRYALHDFSKPLTQSQLADPTPYNTRLHHGLPPGPIANPGLASMTAAAHPAHVTYLYYVDKPNTCGKLAFATTNAQFQADVAAYNTARAKNGGRAPTRCP